MPEDIKQIILDALERWRDRQLDQATEDYAKCMESATSDAERDKCKKEYLKRIKEILELYEKMRKFTQDMYDSVFKKK